MSLVASFAAAGLSSCGSEECFTDKVCGDGKRCSIEKPGDPGECVTCDGTEVPYDGIDNDCNGDTRDRDLDGDRDNAKTAAVGPGGDCDDNDPRVHSRAQEDCTDAKDNDCDGMVDEADCRDRLPPTVSITEPTDNALVSATITVKVMATDDAEITKVELYAGSSQLGVITGKTGPYNFSVNTTQFPDGTVVLRAVAIDIANRTSEASVTIVVDNLSGPMLAVMSPLPNSGYGGRLLIEAMVTDSSGIQSVSFTIPGVAPTNLMNPPFVATVDTRTLRDGPHTLTVSARDTVGNVSMQTVNFTVDNTPPRVRFDNVLRNDILADIVEITVTATDATGVRGISSEGQSTSGSTQLMYMFDTRTRMNGAYVLTATATDVAIIDGISGTGNTATTTVAVQIMNLPSTPVIVLTDPQTGYGVYREVPIKTEVRAPLGVATVDFFVNGLLVESRTMAPWESTFDFAGYSGTSTITVQVMDTMGNMDTDTATVTVVPAPLFRLAAERPLRGTSSPEAYVIEDINRDGVLDFLFASASGLTVNTGTAAGFGFPYRLKDAYAASGDSVVDARMVDLNADNAKDIVALKDTALAVYTNDGTGLGFSGARDSSFGVHPVAGNPTRKGSAFELADLDGDLDIDAVVGNAEAGRADIYVLLQQNNRFVLTGVYGLVGEVTDIELADVDADGDTDVVVGRVRTQFFTVYRNNGRGQFGAGLDSQAGGKPARVKVADMTGDMYPDVVVLFAESAVPAAGFSVCKGVRGTPGIFEQSQTVSLLAKPTDLALGDVDRDGDQDVVLSLPTMNGVDVWHTVRTGTVPLGNRRAYSMAHDAGMPSIRDLNGDNEPEIIVFGARKDVIAIAGNRGRSAEPLRFSAAPLIPIDFVRGTRICELGPVRDQNTRVPNAIAIGELLPGAQPLPELVFGVDRVDCKYEEVVNGQRRIVDRPGGPNPIPPAVLVLQNNGIGDLLPVPQLDLPDQMSPTELAIGDLDARFQADFSIASGATVHVEDQNGNQLPDAPTAALALSNGGGGWTVQELFIDSPKSTAIGDVDNDGRAEALFTTQPSNGTQSGVRVFEMDGSTRFGDHIGFGASSVIAGDFDRDANGWIDFAVANSVTDNVSLYTYAGNGRWNRLLYNTNQSISALITTEITGDNRPDLVGVGQSGVVLLESDPAFGFKTPQPFSAGNPSTPYRIQQGDFNRDGLPDVVVLNRSDDVLAMLIARPQGGYFPPDKVTVSSSPMAMAAGVLYNPGLVDIVAVNSNVPAVLMLLNESPVAPPYRR